ncbi:glycosyltransferase family 32 protein [Acinetobacter pragensis]|uniref:glycosyltransferase family 32 protein n=1 Tax=Acinetobacter pragensis TaxID=1806892 RepID=UPI00334236D7
MGLRKNTKKYFFLLRLHLRFFTDQRACNSEPDNLANPLVINPKLATHIQIPKVIWMFWDNQRPELIEKCIQNIQALNPSYQLIILNNSNIHQYSKINFSDYQNLTPQLQSDLLRLDLLYHHGGIWLDASVILYQSLDWIENLCLQNHTASFGYYRYSNTTIKEFPVIESWLLATEKNNVFFKLWFKELDYAVKSGIKNYIQEIESTCNNYHEYFQNIGLLEYLVIYVACQKVQRQYPASFSLIDCDKNAFLYQSLNGFSNIHFIEALILNFRPQTMPYLIKLIGADRKIITPFFQKKKIKPNSFLDF